MNAIKKRVEFPAGIVVRLIRALHILSSVNSTGTKTQLHGTPTYQVPKPFELWTALAMVLKEWLSLDSMLKGNIFKCPI